MSEKIDKFVLDTISDRKTGVLAVKDYDATLLSAKAIVDENPVPTIENDEQKKQAKAVRAAFNKVVTAIDRRRIDTVADYTSEFEQSCNEIKKLFDERQKEFGAAIKAYEDSQKAVVATAPAVRKFTATIKFTDEKLVKKLTDFCTKNGCELTIK